MTPGIRFAGGQAHDQRRTATPEEAARQGVEVENTGTEPLVSLRYFGPGMAPDARRR